MKNSKSNSIHLPSDTILQEIPKIIKLSKLSISELRKLNDENYPAYNGKELTKEQLIFQLVFSADAPEIIKRKV